MESTTSKERAQEPNAEKRVTRTRVRARNRANNPIPFWQRELVTPTEAVNFLSIGRRKFDQLIDEQRIDTIVIDSRRYIVTASLRRLIDAGRNVRLPEPRQLATAHDNDNRESSAAAGSGEARRDC